MQGAASIEIFENNIHFPVNSYGIALGGGTERIAYRNGKFRFLETHDTTINVEIKLPAGILKILWNGSSLTTDERYLLTCVGHTFWHNPPQIENALPTVKLECFGDNESRILLAHCANEYVIRILDDYPLVIFPLEENLIADVSILRDININLSRLEHQLDLSGRTSSDSSDEVIRFLNNKQSRTTNRTQRKRQIGNRITEHSN